MSSGYVSGAGRCTVFGMGAIREKKLWVVLAVVWVAIVWGWHARWQGHRSGELALVIAGMGIGVLLGQVSDKPAPFQLVLRLDTGPSDNRAFAELHRKFRHGCPRSSEVQFDGFDTDGEWVWFYFRGQDAQLAREKVFGLIRDCPITPGAYFQVVGQEPESVTIKAGWHEATQPRIGLEAFRQREQQTARSAIGKELTCSVSLRHPHLIIDPCADRSARWKSPC